MQRSVFIYSASIIVLESNTRICCKDMHFQSIPREVSPKKDGRVTQSTCVSLIANTMLRVDTEALMPHCRVVKSVRSEANLVVVSPYWVRQLTKLDGWRGPGLCSISLLFPVTD